MSTNIGVSGQFSFSDSITGNQRGATAIPAITASVTVSENAQYTIGTATTAITLPISPITFAYLYNASTGNNLNVIWTPSGGTSTAVQTITPGNAILFTGGSISALSLSASASPTSVSAILAG